MHQPGSQLPGQIVLRWRRFMARLVSRLDWHIRGVLLWLLQRPTLRWVPLPYPSVGSIPQWREQAKAMVQNHTMARRHLRRALQAGAFTMRNLQDGVFLRNRLGLEFSFLEDNVMVMGMKAARSAKGMKAKIRHQAMLEGKQEASKEKEAGRQQQAARELIGPRGGLPTLRADLLRLAALLNVELDEKATVEQIKKQVKPMVALMMKDTSSSRDSPTRTPVMESTRQPYSPPRDQVSTSSTTTQGLLGPMGESGIAASIRREVQDIVSAQEMRFQGFVHQALSHMMSMQSTASGIPQHMSLTPTEVKEDQEMYTPEEVAQMNADYYEYMRVQREGGQPTMREILQDELRGIQEEEAKNRFTLNQEVKKGVAQLVAQAWSRHEKERGLISKSHKEIYEVLKEDWFRSIEGGINEAFISSVSLEPPPLVSEIFTTTQRAQKEAERRGHSTGTWNFLLPEHRERAKEVVREEKPFFLMIAFPCNPWSALLRLNSAVDLDRIRADGLVLVKFSLELAEIQIEGGRHYASENPLTSEAWRTPEMEKFFNEHRYFEAIFDQFNLRGRSGHLHKKATKVISSSGALRDELHGRRCLRDHQHEPVIGGSSVTRPAGHYPSKLARCLVKGMEAQFDEEMNKKHDVNVASAEGGDGEFCFEASDSDDGGATTGTETLRVPGAVKTAIRRLHENTGHRSNLRLARALAISGAPPMVVHAAKVHRCSICDEKRAPKARRPASLPTPKDAGDQANVDMIEIFDAAGNKFYAIHMIDYATRFQMAEVLPNKSTTQVLSFIRKRWLPVFGAPRVLVADQGREFISWEFEEFCSAHSILLWHCGVGAPWQNGICERAGGTLKVILAAVVASHQIFGFEALEEALGEAVGAYNNDVNESGVSPAQAAIGKQPKILGDVLGGGFSERLAEHSLVDSKPSIARQVALRETAKVAML